MSAAEAPFRARQILPGTQRLRSRGGTRFQLGSAVIRHSFGFARPSIADQHSSSHGPACEAGRSVVSSYSRLYTVSGVQTAARGARRSRPLRRTGEQTAMIRLNFCRPKSIVASLSILGAAVLFATLGEFAAGGNEPPAYLPACRLGAVDASCSSIKDEEKEEEPEQFETRLFVAEADGSKMKPLVD